jgi:CheY-like chemotaxis protein
LTTALQSDAAAAVGTLSPCDRGRILVVDDEKIVQDVFKLVLSMELPDLQIDTAGDGVEAVDAFGHRHHAVLLMDLRMPRMDGRQAFLAIESLCRERGWRMPSVVFCSGYAPPDAVRTVVARDATHALLTKPVSNETLVSVVRSRLTS